MRKIQGIPIHRFSQIVKEAEKAYKREDWLTVGKLNQELNAINTGVFWQDGKAYLWALQEKPLPFDDIITVKNEADMTLYRDEDGNLESDDFIPRLASDEDLLERYRKAWKAAKTDFNQEVAKMMLLCSIQLGQRGYRTNADESDWYKPDNQSS
jgi:hypothetical protein